MGKTMDTIRVQYDDGAGHTKMLAEIEGKPPIREKIRSMVALHNTAQTFGMGIQHTTVELPNATGRVFGNGVMYTMGDHVALQANAQLDTTATRYLAEPGALVRFYTNLGVIAERTGLTKFHAEIVAGVATGMYNDLQELVQRKLSGQHYFRFNGKDITVEVDSVSVGPQAYYAAQSVIRNPPSKLLPMLKQYPMEKNSVVVIDVGDFSTDIAILAGDGKQIAPTEFFSLNYGVGELRTQLANHLLSKLGLSPLPSDLDQAITPTSSLFGKVPGKRLGDKAIDVSETVKTFAQSIWSDVWSAVTRATRGKTGNHYVIVTGGGSIIFAEHIQKSPVDDVLFANHPGMVATGSEWSVVEGMKK